MEKLLKVIVLVFLICGFIIYSSYVTLSKMNILCRRLYTV